MAGNGWLAGWPLLLLGACCWATGGSEREGARKKAGMEVPVHRFKEWGGTQVQHMSRDDANGIHAHQDAAHLCLPSGGPSLGAASRQGGTTDSRKTVKSGCHSCNSC